MSVLKEHLVRAYHDASAGLGALQRVLEERLSPVAARPSLAIHSVSSRVKSRASLQRKLARPDRNYEHLSDITDLVGLRVITYFEDALLDVASFIEETFRVDLARSMDKARALGPEQFGYRSLHYVCRVPAEALERAKQVGSPLPDELCFEIQVRTILQHAWAEIEHDLGYKADDVVPLPVKRRFSRLAGLMELADAEFVAIRRSLGEYREEVARAMSRDAGDLVLDAVSLECFLGHPEVGVADALCASAVFLAPSAEPFHPDYLLRMLRLAGFESIQGLESRLRERRSALAEFAPAYFKFTDLAWGFGARELGSFPRGYCLVFLAHLALLESTPLELARLEKVSAFYVTLDRPLDASAARRIARCFLETVRRTPVD